MADLVFADSLDGISVSLGLGGGRFAPVNTLPISSTPSSVALGDFDGDGRLDVAVSLQGSNEVAVLRGHNDGTFESPIRLAVGLRPFAVISYDLDHDGVSDLAVANYDSDDVSVLLGIAGGAFAPQVRTAAGDGPIAVAAGDFDDDGLTDLAVANWLPGTVSLLPGRGDGSFGARLVVPVGSLPRSIAAADFNNDGMADFAVANRDSGDVSVLLGAPRGVTPSEVRYAAGRQSMSVAVCDCDGDARADIAVLNSNPEAPLGDISLLLGRGDGTFAATPRQEVGGHPSFLLSADLNQDRWTDLASLGGGVAELLFNSGDGRFGFQSFFPTEASSESISLGDLNRDGLLDIVSVGRPRSGVETSNRLSVLLGRGDGVFQTLSGINPGPAPRATALADFNEDGILDIAVAHDVSNEVAILLGAGDGTFGPPSFFGVGDLPVAVVAGDFDADGHQDLAVENLYSGDLSLLRGHGDGRFDAAQSVVTGYGQSELIAADLNGDEATDLAYVAGDALHLLFGSRDWTFATASQPLQTEGIYALAGGDLNGDGIEDFAALGKQSHFVTVLLGRGDGTFDSKPRGSRTSGQRLVVADFTGDGRQDLVTFGGSYDLFVLPGRGDGAFDPSVVIQEGTIQDDIRPGDFNGDGSEDLAVASGPQSVHIVLSAGAAAVSSPTRLPAGLAPNPVLSADFNNDGKPDLAVAGVSSAPYSPGLVGIHLAKGSGQFNPPMTFDVSVLPSDVAAEDFNRDGRVDLAVACSGGSFQISPPPLPLTPVPGELSILLGSGDGSFVRGAAATTAGENPLRVKVADLDLDGLDDLVIGSSQSVSVLPGRGDGTFGAPTWSISGIGMGAITLADLDGDGSLDLIVAGAPTGAYPKQVNVFRGQGDGTFELGVGYGPSTNLSPTDVLTADLDLDGALDLIVADHGTAAGQGAVWIFKGLGPGGLAEGARVPAGGGPLSLAVADFTRDRILDLAVANQDGYATLLVGEGEGAFSPAIHFRAGGIPAHLTSLDLNADGAPDLAASLPGSKSIALLINRLKPRDNTPPVAVAGPDIIERCVSPPGVLVTLNGAGSFDSDSTPGTHDDISLFEWFENFGQGSQVLLGQEEILPLIFGPGTHSITLRVTDSVGATGVDGLLIQITESGPQVSVALTPSTLWPPNHRMVAVRASVTISGMCSETTIVLDSLVSSEPDDAEDRGDGATIGDIRGAGIGGADFDFELRAERSGSGGGRTYTATYRATSVTGAVGVGSGFVAVPLVVNGNTDPLLITVTGSSGGTLLSWSAVPGASHYDVVRGEVRNLLDTGDIYQTGPLTCIASSTPRTDTEGAEDTESPPVGQVFFYLVQCDDGFSSGYGTESAARPIMPSQAGIVCAGEG